MISINQLRDYFGNKTFSIFFVLACTITPAGRSLSQVTQEGSLDEIRTSILEKHKLLEKAYSQVSLETEELSYRGEETGENLVLRRVSQYARDGNKFAYNRRVEFSEHPTVIAGTELAGASNGVMHIALDRGIAGDPVLTDFGDRSEVDETIVRRMVPVYAAYTFHNFKMEDVFELASFNDVSRTIIDEREVIALKGTSHASEGSYIELYFLPDSFAKAGYFISYLGDQNKHTEKQVVEYETANSQEDGFTLPKIKRIKTINKGETGEIVKTRVYNVNSAVFSEVDRRRFTLEGLGLAFLPGGAELGSWDNALDGIEGLDDPSAIGSLSETSDSTHNNSSARDDLDQFSEHIQNDQSRVNGTFFTERYLYTIISLGCLFLSILVFVKFRKKVKYSGTVD